MESSRNTHYPDSTTKFGISFDSQIKDLTLELLKEEKGSEYTNSKKEEIKIADKYPLWVTKPIEELGKELNSEKKTSFSIKNFAKPTGETHFQINLNDKPIAFARAHQGGSKGDWHLTELFISDLAKEIDESANCLIQYKKRDSNSNIDLLLVSQLHIYQPPIYAFCWSIDTELNSQVYCIDSENVTHKKLHGKAESLNLDDFIRKIIVSRPYEQESKINKIFQKLFQKCKFSNLLLTTGVTLNIIGFVMISFGETDLGISATLGGFGLEGTILAALAVKQKHL